MQGTLLWPSLHSFKLARNLGGPIACNFCVAWRLTSIHARNRGGMHLEFPVFVFVFCFFVVFVFFTCPMCCQGCWNPWSYCSSQSYSPPAPQLNPSEKFQIWHFHQRRACQPGLGLVTVPWWLHHKRGRREVEGLVLSAEPTLPRRWLQRSRWYWEVTIKCRKKCPENSPKKCPKKYIKKVESLVLSDAPTQLHHWLQRLSL